MSHPIGKIAVGSIVYQGYAPLVVGRVKAIVTRKATHDMAVGKAGGWREAEPGENSIPMEYAEVAWLKPTKTTKPRIQVNHLRCLWELIADHKKKLDGHQKRYHDALDIKL